MNTPTASSQGLALCHCCRQLARLGGPRCPRCGSPLHRRKVNSIARSWALIATATILYIPANVYPIMTVVRFGQGSPDTILSGVKHLIESGLWPLALLVFVASIVVPIMKIIILSYLLISVQRHSRWRPKDRTLIYRITELVGSWSMVDIFLITILVALVNMGNIATVEVGDGATFFGAVVVTTMLAAHSFDPRLIWDHQTPADE